MLFINSGLKVSSRFMQASLQKFSPETWRMWRSGRLTCAPNRKYKLSDDNPLQDEYEIAISLTDSAVLIVQCSRADLARPACRVHAQFSQASHFIFKLMI
jgi:hypothetical protein